VELALVSVYDWPSCEGISLPVLLIVLPLLQLDSTKADTDLVSHRNIITASSINEIITLLLQCQVLCN
jgi:hypothetical protein